MVRGSVIASSVVNLGISPEIARMRPRTITIIAREVVATRMRILSSRVRMKPTAIGHEDLSNR